jgi:FixJ family two-component response regulator
VNEFSSNRAVITIVDDDEPLREALGSLLKAAGFSINAFASAEEFLAATNRQDTSCLLLDVRLPGMSGIELQRRLLDANCGLQIIFITAHGDESLRDLVMKAGAAGFLTKPVRRDTLLREIHGALQKTGTDQHS